MSLASYYNHLAQVAFGDDGEDESPREADTEPQDVLVARGDTLLDDGDEGKVKSELPDVTDEQWTQFVRAMLTGKLTKVTASNALGMFELMPRRLADMGIVREPTRSKSPQGRTVWVTTFKAPLTAEKFLRSPQVQYTVFVQSMKDYAGKIASGAIEKDPAMSLAGALTILHKCGPSGLTTWATAEHFPATQALYDRTEGLF